MDQKDFIITMIDDHEHVIDCIKFAPESACQTIQSADYSKVKLTGDLNQTNNSGENDETRGADDSEFAEEQKRFDESDASIIDGNRLTTKEKVAKLKEDLKKRKAMLRGEIENNNEGEAGDGDIQIDTRQQEE
jgi:hypothetical protein